MWCAGGHECVWMRQTVGTTLGDRVFDDLMKDSGEPVWPGLVGVAVVPLAVFVTKGTPPPLCSPPGPPSMGYFRSVASCMLLHYLSRTRSPDPGTQYYTRRWRPWWGEPGFCGGLFCWCFLPYFSRVFFWCSTGCNCHACVTLCCSCCFGCCSAING